ncbi:MAG: hypothetical protein KF715_04745 [Candidatus Didemnitutus sp.]|nr:hypothetical protein [Candidatus Didemnitutus sp.]
MNPHNQQWLRLIAAARSAPNDRDESAPFGFATRVAALGLMAPAAVLPRAVFEKFALRGLFAACALSAAAAAFGYSAFTSEQETEAVAGDTVTEVLAQS